MTDLITQLRRILTPELCLAAYEHKFPWVKGTAPSGTLLGQAHFKPSKEHMKAFYDLVFHSALLPLSRLPLQDLLDADLTLLLPAATATQYPEHSLGLVIILDQQRTITAGYGSRYTRSFFDPIAEKLARQLIALPEDIRPDGKQAWLSRGYSIDEWLIRTFFVWAPLTHSDAFMTANRQRVKDWLHQIRSIAEDHCGYSDPFAPLESQDDADLNVFLQMLQEGPPLHSYGDASKAATPTDYTFWFIRIVNAHFASVDMCGHYPFAIRWSGVDWTEKDKEFMEKTNYAFVNPNSEPILQQVKEDHLNGVWRALPTNPKYET